MRKIFTLLLVIVFCNGLWAQSVKITTLWDHSINGTADWSQGFPMGGTVPSWMGNMTERGLAHLDGKLYIPSRSSNTIVVLDALTGNKIEEIDIDASVSGGTYPFNDISITTNGDIVLCNLTTASKTSPFKVYVLSDDGTGTYKTVKTLIEWTSPVDELEPEFRIGDGFGVYGDVASGNGYVIAAHNGLPGRVFRWNVTAGVAATDPVIFDVKNVLPAVDEGKDPKIGLSPKFWPVNDDLVWIDGHSIVPAAYNMTGEMVTTFDVNGALPKTSGISGVSYFTFKDRDFMWLPTTNHVVEPYAAFEAFEIPRSGGMADAVSLGVYPEKGMGANVNSSYAAPVAIDVQLDKVILFALSPLNGVAAFELTIDGATAIGDVESESVRFYPNPASSDVNFDAVMDVVQIFDLAGKLVKEARDIQELSVSELKGIYILKGVSKDGQSVCDKLIVK